MPDMLVKLYELESPGDVRERDYTVRRPMAYEKYIVTSWVTKHFTARWASECEAAFARNPISCYIATSDGEILGFGCYDATARGFFGPTGVSKAARGRGIGTAILHACLAAMREIGYAYAIIGGAGPAAFYERTVGAIEIPGSTPGIYTDRLNEENMAEMNPATS